ncbi:hypothetical protein [Spirosoma aerophilum]
MNVQRFKELTLAEQVILIPLKGRFIAQRQDSVQQVKLYYWHDHFLEIYYKWPAKRGMGAHWEAYKVSSFLDNLGCTDKLVPYAEHVSLSDLNV